MSETAARPSGRIVIVEDDADLLEQLTWALKGKFAVSAARDATHGRVLCESEPDLYLFDLRLPPSGQVQEGLDLLRHVRQRDPEATVVMMSGEGERPIRAAGDRARRLRLLPEADRYGRAPADPESRPRAPAAPRREPGAPAGRAAGEVLSTASWAAAPRCVPWRGTSRGLREATPRCSSSARAARARTSSRSRSTPAAPGATGPSSPVNASALPESLAEAELFGHEKGAFTGAIASRPGRFELAQGGTLFLDEIGTLSPAVQAKLLRVLESREVERVGGRRPIPVDFRLISATNEDLEARVAAGTFREDLFYRIHTVPLRIAPLRERGEDIALLAEHFLALFGQRHGKVGPAPVRRCPRAAPRLMPGRETCASCSTSSRCSSSSPTPPRSARRSCRGLCARGRGGRDGAAPRRRTSRRPSRSSSAGRSRRRSPPPGGVKAEAARRLGLDANQIKYLCRKYGL